MIGVICSKGGCSECSGLTRRLVWVVFGKDHGGFEVATVVHRFLVQHDQGDVPSEDVVFVKLWTMC